MAYKYPNVIMRKVFFMLSFLSVVSAFSQNPISIERIINDLDWENCTESDVILAFKDNVVKRDKVEEWDGGEVSSFILKNVQIGECISDANIIVNKYNRKLLKIGGMILRDYDWSKGADVISQKLEDYFSSFWGKDHIKIIEYETDLDDEETVFSNIKCEWMDTYHNDKTSKGTCLIMQRVKVIVIAVEPK